MFAQDICLRTHTRTCRWLFTIFYFSTLRVSQLYKISFCSFLFHLNIYSLPFSFFRSAYHLLSFFLSADTIRIPLLKLTLTCRYLCECVSVRTHTETCRYSLSPHFNVISNSLNRLLSMYLCWAVHKSVSFDVVRFSEFFGIFLSHFVRLFGPPFTISDSLVCNILELDCNRIGSCSVCCLWKKEKKLSFALAFCFKFYFTVNTKRRSVCMCVFKKKERKKKKLARTIWQTHTQTQTYRIVFGVKENVWSCFLFTIIIIISLKWGRERNNKSTKHKWNNLWNLDGSVQKSVRISIFITIHRWNRHAKAK